MYLLIVYLVLQAYGVSALRFPRYYTGNVNITYTTKYFPTYIDHFSFVDERQFNLKYLINNDSFIPGGPILLYTGNEGKIEGFAENSGFIWELAKELKGCVVFAEHRYYGSSGPFGNDSYKDREHFGYLTAEQALADFAVLVKQLKNNYSVFDSSPVIAFGGSYGGMLSAWFRQKYPNIVAGALASSAPVWLFPGLSDCEGFNFVVTKVFAELGGDKCVSNFRRVWKSISQIAEGPDGKTMLSRFFNACAKETDPQELTDYLIDFVGTTAMVNYPYPTNFLSPLPGWPVKYLCSNLSTFDPSESDEKTVMRMAKAILSITNYTGKQECFDIKDSSENLNVDGWYLQTCMEMTTPMCTDGQRDMFPPSKWDIDQYKTMCLNKFGVAPRINWSDTQFWGKNLKTVTNIIFSNGMLDPWSAFSVLNQTDVPNALVINITDSAHHLDLRASNEADPPSVIEARKLEKAKIIEWIQEWKINHGLF